MLEFDVLFGRYEMGTSPQNLYEGCDLEAIAGDALSGFGLAPFHPSFCDTLATYLCNIHRIDQGMVAIFKP